MLSEHAATRAKQPNRPYPAMRIAVVEMDMEVFVRGYIPLFENLLNFLICWGGVLTD